MSGRGALPRNILNFRLGLRKPCAARCRDGGERYRRAVVANGAAIAEIKMNVIEAMTEFRRDLDTA